MDRVYFSKNHMLVLCALSHVLPWPQLSTYALLLWSVDHEFKAHLTQAEMAKELGCSERTVRGNLKKLEDLGLIKFWRGPDGANFYRLLFPLPDSVVKAIKEQIPGYQPEAKPRPQATARPHDETVARKVNGAHRRQPQPTSGPTEEFPVTTDQAHQGESTGRLSEDGDRLSESVNSKALHPEIAKIVDAVKRGDVSTDNPTVQFFVHLGFLEKGKFDEAGLAQWLIDCEGNDFEAFCRLREKFIEDPKSVSRTELIKLPMFSIEFGRYELLRDYLWAELQDYVGGCDWLLTAGGISRMAYSFDAERLEVEIRKRFEEFMRENGFQSLEDAIAAAKRFDGAATAD